MKEVLQQIQDFADRAHGDQMRKFAPERYIAHPIRVMELCREQTNDTGMLAAALLHDVLEDTPVSKEALNEFLLEVMNDATAQRTLHLVVELTDIYTKRNYPDWNRRKRKAREVERLSGTSADAQTIKYADIIDNSAEIAMQDTDFARVFLRECRTLLTKMNKGNKILYQKALDTVDAGLRHLKE
ncbi:HD domain-containing protein [Paraflavitalea soli]|uniref:HD domain-containing protein n=1 Tax=Paraflavitalea soli TaxID=2315862 RepID=A0A3B7MQJ7_9BACT|nr:HD domain-containing protein [Paraflavitalea soli]AXY76814.1 HD domain-containing protein [Paraflavitalea soli]